MPFIIPVIAGAVALVTTIAAIPIIGSLVVGAALSFGLSYLAKALAPKPAAAPASLGGVQTTVQFGANLPRSALFGEQATAGALVYWNAYSGDNEALQLVYVLGDGLHDSLVGMYVNGLPVTIEGTPVTSSFPTARDGTNWATGYPITEYRDPASNEPTMLVEFFDGSDSQAADSDLVSHANPPGRWPSNNTLTGMCYVRVSMWYTTTTNLTGIPQFLFVIKGKRCYDPRKDSTNGGTGAHRWGTQSTYEWTANPAICLYNYQRGIYINGSLVLGQGLSTNDMINDAYVAAANSCDEDVTLVLGGASISSIGAGGTGHAVGDVLTLTGGTFTVPILVRIDEVTAGVITHATIIQSGHFTASASNPVAEGSTSGFGVSASFNLTWTSTEKRYRVGMQVAANVQHRDAITAFLSSMAGTLLEDAGSFAPQAGVGQTVALSFTDSDLVAGQQQTYSSHRSHADLINAVFGTYSEPVQNWASISSPPRVSSADATEDGEELATTIDFPMIYSGTQAQRVEEITRRLARLQKTAAIVLPFKFSVLEPGDWVTWASARFGFTDTFLITATTLNADQTIALTLREISSAAFGWTAATDELSGTAPTNLAGFNDLATTVDAFVIIGIQLDAAGGLTTPALQCTWTAITDPTVVAVLVNYRIQGATDFLTKRFDTPGTGVGIISSAIQANTIYEAQATIETKPPRITAWTSWVATAYPVGSQIVGLTLTTIADDAVKIATFDAALKYAVTTAINDALAAISKANDLVASLSAEQDAANWLDKVNVKTILAQSVTDQGSAIAAAMVTVEATAESSASAALAAYVITVDASFGDTSALITNESIARAGGDSAIATTVTSLTTTVGGHTSSISTITSSVNGISVEYGVIGTIDGVTGGFIMSGIKKLDGSVSYSVEIEGSLLVDGTITAAKIGAGEITAVKMAASSITAANGAIDNLAVNTLQVAGSAITVPLTASWTGSIAGTGARVGLFGTYMTIVGIAGQSYTIAVTAKTEQNMAGPMYAEVFLVVNGVDLDIGHNYLNGGSAQLSALAIGSYTFTSSGTDTFLIEIDWWGTSGSHAIYSSFVAMAAKR